MRPLILATTLWLALLTPALAQQPPALWKGDVPKALPPINLDDAPDAYAIYKCVLTNDIIRERLPFFVDDCGWGKDVTRRVIYAAVYMESRLNPYVVVHNEPGNPYRDANGLLQITQIMIDERKRKTGEASFSGSELADPNLPPEDTYLRSLDVLNDMAKAKNWDTPEKVASWWYCWTCPDPEVKAWRIANFQAAYEEFAEMELRGRACAFQCNTAPWKTIP